MNKVSMMSIRKLRVIMVGFVVSVCCVAVFSRGGDSTADQLADKAVIALVNGRAIPYSVVKVTVDAARSRFVYEHERSPATDADVQEVERIRQRYEVKQLVSYIQGTIRSQQVARFGIECSDAELQARWERILEERDQPATQARNRAKLANLLDCVRAVHESSADPDSVYDTRLTYRMTRKEWKSVLRQYGAPESRRSLEKLLSDDQEFDESAKDAARSALIMEKTMEAVEEELIRTDPEFAEYMRLARTDPRNEKVQSKGPNYKTGKRYGWWQERYREAEIELKDERFKDALKELFK